MYEVILIRLILPKINIRVNNKLNKLIETDYSGSLIVHRTNLTSEIGHFFTLKALDTHFYIHIFGDICRRNGDMCKQQPLLAPIQSKNEGVSFKMEIS